VERNKKAVVKKAQVLLDVIAKETSILVIYSCIKPMIIADYLPNDRFAALHASLAR